MDNFKVFTLPLSIALRLLEPVQADTVQEVGCTLRRSTVHHRDDRLQESSAHPLKKKKKKSTPHVLAKKRNSESRTQLPTMQFKCKSLLSLATEQIFIC